MIDNLYQKSLPNVSAEDLVRNKFRSNELYEYDYRLE